MSQGNLCRLCVNICQHHKILYDENGQGNEVYQVSVKYFHPKLFNITSDQPFVVLCLDCWSQIFNFHNFQNFVFQSQNKLYNTCPSVKVKYESEFQSRESGLFQAQIEPHENGHQNSFAIQTQNEQHEHHHNFMFKYENPCPTNEGGSSVPQMQNALDEYGQGFRIKQEEPPLAEDCNTDGYLTQIATTQNENQNYITVPKLEIMDVSSNEDSSQDQPTNMPHTDPGKVGSIQNEAKRKKRGKYKINSQEDKMKIVNASSRGEDWVSLASSLGVNYQTAYHWVSSGSIEVKPKGGMKPKKLNETHVATLISWLENDYNMTLEQLREKIQQHLNISVASTTVGNYLEGMLYSCKKYTSNVHSNSYETKQNRAQYVQMLSYYMREGKHIVWVDETNFNLYCRKVRGRSRIGQRDLQELPAARGPNVNLIAAISSCGVLLLERQRGPFTSNTCSEWISYLLQKWIDIGNDLSDLVIVCDYSPCFSSIEMAVERYSGQRSTVLRLCPYSPMLNPAENIWEKINTNVKARFQEESNAANGAVAMDQKLETLEKCLDEVNATITSTDCTIAVQQASLYYEDILSFKDVQMRTYKVEN